MTTRRVCLFLVAGLCAVSLACWLVMFLSGSDVWNSQGRPDFWNLQGPPYTDMRAFAYAFYGQFVVLLGILAFAGWSLASDRSPHDVSPRD
jgi:hypothetical protein